MAVHRMAADGAESMFLILLKYSQRNLPSRFSDFVSKTVFQRLLRWRGHLASKVYSYKHPIIFFCVKGCLTFSQSFQDLRALIE